LCADVLESRSPVILTSPQIITEALVAQIILAPGEGGDLSASGVKFLSKGQAFVAQANKEVILSAGCVYPLVVWFGTANNS